jgi:hypothetical protein
VGATHDRNDTRVVFLDKFSHIPCRRIGRCLYVNPYDVRRILCYLFPDRLPKRMCQVPQYPLIGRVIAEATEVTGMAVFPEVCVVNQNVMSVGLQETRKVTQANWYFVKWVSYHDAPWRINKHYFCHCNLVIRCVE